MNQKIVPLAAAESAPREYLPRLVAAAEGRPAERRGKQTFSDIVERLRTMRVRNLVPK